MLYLLSICLILKQVHSRLCYALMLFVASISIANAQENWVPYSASYTTITAVSGQSTSVVTGTRARNTSGDVTETEFIADTQQVKHKTLYQANPGIFFSIDPVNRRAIGTNRRVGHLKVTPESTIGREVVGTFATTVIPIRNPNQQAIIGKAWVIDGTDIILKIHSQLPNGTYDLNLRDVKLYQQPDASLFTIPAGFAVSKPTTP